jgi:anaerobic selenocysteine-containing dehydrogenase
MISAARSRSPLGNMGRPGGGIMALREASCHQGSTDADPLPLIHGP